MFTYLTPFLNRVELVWLASNADAVVYTKLTFELHFLHIKKTLSRLHAKKGYHDY